MRVDTKQMYFVFILITLKINASPVNETNELHSLEREVLSSSLDTSPNIRYTTGSKQYLVLNHCNLDFVKLTNSTLWQYGLWRFQIGGTKLERFLPKNQQLLNFENWISGGLRSFQK